MVSSSEEMGKADLQSPSELETRDAGLQLGHETLIVQGCHEKDRNKRVDIQNQLGPE